MMFPSNSPRRVSVRQQQLGAAIAHIARHNQWPMYIIIWGWLTGGLLVFLYFPIAAFFRNPLSTQEIVLIPFTALILFCFVLAARIGMWRVFGVEDIVVENGRFSWTRTALFWRRKLELPATEITAMRPSTPWHDLSNRVEFIAHGRLYRIGDMLRRDEAYELADALTRAVKPPNEKETPL